MLEETLLLSPKQWPDLGGTWSSLGDDGTYSDITLIINASSAGGFGVTCTDAGPDDGCDPVTARHDTQGRVGGWHHAHGSTHARSVKVQFDNQAMNSGITDANNSVIAWQDGSRCASQKLFCCCSSEKDLVRCRGAQASRSGQRVLRVVHRRRTPRLQGLDTELCACQHLFLFAFQRSDLAIVAANVCYLMKGVGQVILNDFDT